MKENMHERTHNENHAGKHSETTRIDAMVHQLRMWRNERIASHEAGHKESELCFPGEIGGHFQIDQIPQDQEIVLFDPLDKPQ